MFYKNLGVDIVYNKIISKQNKGTPGVYKIFNIKSNTRYKIKLTNFDSGNATVTLWIGNINNKLISNNKIDDINNLYYDSKIGGKLKIGILFKKTHINQYFNLKDIGVEEDTFLLDNILSDEYYILKNKIINNAVKENNIIKEPMSEIEKISIIIPCHYKHFQYIDQLLQMYNKQSMIPTEIIVVLCESTKISENIIDNAENKKYKYNLKIIRIKEKSAAGKNRYIGTKEAIGDIIIFQDADDLPHPQRIEIIQRCFKQYPSINHILHSCSRSIMNTFYNIDKIPTKICKHNIFLNQQEMGNYKLTNGNIAIRNKIVNEIKWDIKNFRGQDVQLNKNIYEKYGEYMIIVLALYVYREKLTTRYFL